MPQRRCDRPTRVVVGEAAGAGGFCTGDGQAALALANLAAASAFAVLIVLLAPARAGWVAASSVLVAAAEGAALGARVGGGVGGVPNTPIVKPLDPAAPAVGPSDRKECRTTTRDVGSSQRKGAYCGRASDSTRSPGCP